MSVCLTTHLARKRVQPGNRMQENCTSGTVRGVPCNRHSYRRGSKFRAQLSNLQGDGGEYATANRR
jgi:hypothetical protein